MGPWGKKQLIDEEKKVLHKMRKTIGNSLYDMILSDDHLTNGVVDVDKFHKMILCAKEAMGLLNLLVEFQLDDKWRKTLDS